jgi:hypothetical protein
MARTGLRIMPTFPLPPLTKIPCAGFFPGTASRPAYPARPSLHAGLPSPFMRSASIAIPRSVSKDDALVFSLRCQPIRVTIPCAGCGDAWHESQGIAHISVVLGLGPLHLAGKHHDPAFC